jgi:hypothetical protein
MFNAQQGVDGDCCSHYDQDTRKFGSHQCLARLTAVVTLFRFVINDAGSTLSLSFSSSSSSSSSLVRVRLRR